MTSLLTMSARLKSTSQITDAASPSAWSTVTASVLRQNMNMSASTVKTQHTQRLCAVSLAGSAMYASVLLRFSGVSIGMSKPESDRRLVESLQYEKNSS